ncbi:MAG: Gfo/Idh/MocA family oxidoreductase [Clostridia bacterium]|nr:Gfo/Idh/MocA family oxidoreductase [Clostridia bacterium]
MKKCVIVGIGQRSLQAYVIPLTKELADCVEICGVYDLNHKRAACAAKFTGCDIPVFDDFDTMLEETRPDVVLVTTIDSCHDEYIIKALEFGCDVITEKPMTTDDMKCNAILEAEKRTGKDLKVTFNARFRPFYTRVKELMDSGIVGDVLSVHFEWMLGTKHGGDYFRRWHRQRKNSGSLLIHKSTHHFDLLNWWINDEPEAVNAFGSLRFYGPTREERGERCLTCAYKDKCEFYFDLPTDEFLGQLYYENEDVDGYYRDRCIFSDEIDIEDSVAVNIKYKKGTVVCYTLTAYSPYEGCKIVFNGSKGRLEVDHIRTGINSENPYSIRLYNALGEEIKYNFKKEEIVTTAVQSANGLTRDNDTGHGGSDPLMRAMLFRGVSSDPLGHIANSRAGAYSIGIGIAANKSMKEHRQVSLSEFLPYTD